MHPNTAYHWSDRDSLREFVRMIGFGMVFATTPDGPRVAHVPVVWSDDATLQFHLARGNALTRHLDGANALFVANGPDGYISPDWYREGEDQVPTWNYVAVELDGVARKVDRPALVAMIDQLSAENETRLAPKAPWTRDKMNPTRFDRMCDAIQGFALQVQGWRGTRKLAQAKAHTARMAVADALDEQGQRALAHWMREGLA